MAAVAPNRLQNLRTLRSANVDAAFATAFGTLVTGSFLVGFIRYLGGGDVWIGVMTAVPSFLGLLQIPGALWGRSFSSYKRFVTPGGLIWRLFYVPLIALPFLPISTSGKLIILFSSVAIASAAVQIVQPIFNDWLAEMVPSNSRGWFFSRRNSIAAASGAIVGLLGGFILDAFKRSDHEKLGYTAIFTLGVVCSGFSLLFFNRMSDTARESPIHVPLRQALLDLKRPIGDRRFRAVLIFFVVFVAGQAFAGNLFSAFALESLRMPFTVLQTTALMHAAGNVLSARMWGYLSDKYGNKPIIAILASGLFFTPVVWLFCVPGEDLRNAIILISGHLFVGVVWGGIGVCQFNLLLATADPDDRANYIGVGLALQAIVGAISPLAGAFAMSALRGVLVPELAYKATFAIAMSLRFLAVFFLLGVQESGSVSIRGTLRQLRQWTPKGYRALQQLTRSSDVATRESAMESAGIQQFGVAADEILKALHDPSPRLRRQAASSLAKLGDSRAVEALIHQLEEHPDLVEEETIEALGELGDPRAVASLCRYLESPRSLTRRAAARALGRIGSQDAVPPLIQAAIQPQDPDMRRAALQALRLLRAVEAGAAIADALLDSYPSVRIAAAEAIEELNLRESSEALRQSLDWYDDEASSEVAYALGCVGDETDIPRILKVAAHCVSVITRRRCLLGVARILGVEQETYRLMLLDGMSRDAALLERLKSVLRGNKRLRTALDLYSSAREPEAIELLKQSRKTPWLAGASSDVEELFLVAASAIRRQARMASSSTGKGRSRNV